MRILPPWVLRYCGERYFFLLIVGSSGILLYEKYGKYYNLIYSSIDYDGEVEEISNLLQAEQTGIKSILDIGCGTGSYVLRLSKKGYVADGIDSSPPMIEAAKSKLREADIQASVSLEDVKEFSFEKSYDAVICLFGSFDYLYEDSDIQGLFKGIHQSLSNGGIFMLDFLNAEFFKHNQPKPVILEGKQSGMKSFRSTFPKVDLNAKRLELEFKCTIYRGRDILDYFEEVHSLRIFDPEQVTRLLVENNFTLESNSRKGFYTRILARKQA